MCPDCVTVYGKNTKLYSKSKHATRSTLLQMYINTRHSCCICNHLYIYHVLNDSWEQYLFICLWWHLSFCLNYNYATSYYFKSQNFTYIQSLNLQFIYQLFMVLNKHKIRKPPPPTPRNEINSNTSEIKNELLYKHHLCRVLDYLLLTFIAVSLPHVHKVQSLPAARNLCLSCKIRPKTVRFISGIP